MNVETAAVAAGPKVQFFSAVILVSTDPERLVRFYRGALGISLEEERHDDTLPHWGCTLGDLHFAIHPIEDFPEAPQSGVGAIKLAFTVFQLDELIDWLSSQGHQLLYQPKDLGWCRMAALEDPDGNLIELTELDEEWFKMLASKRARGADLLSQWQAQRACPS